MMLISILITQFKNQSYWTYKDSSFFVDITAAQGATILGRDLYKLVPGETKVI